MRWGCVVLLLAACESVPAEERDAGIALGLDAAVDGKTAGDLAPHLVALAAPTSIEISYELVDDGAVAHLRWARSDDPRATRVRVVRRAESLPQGPFDTAAQLVYEGTAGESRERVRELAALETSFYAAFSCDDAGGCEGAGVQRPFAVTLGQALLDGGYNVYLRHGTASLCSDDLALGPAATTSSPDWWRSCQRACAGAPAAQLDANGAGQASIVGDALRSHGVPFGRVITSEFCRARETAQGLSLSPQIETAAALTYFVYDESARCASVKDAVRAAPAPGKNDVFVGHGDFSEPCDPFSSLQPGEAAVYRAATSTEAARFVMLVSATAWATLP